MVATRRAFLRTAARASAATVATGGMVIMATPAAADGASPTLLAAIDAHHRVYAEWMVIIDRRNALDEQHFAEREAVEAAGASRDELRALLAKHKADPHETRINAEERIAIRREVAAMETIIDMPVSSVADVNAKIACMMALPDGDEAFGAIDNRLTRFMRSIATGGLA